MGRALLAALALLAASAHAAPFLVADVPDQAEIDACTVVGLPAGSYTVTARATSSLWGLTSEPSSPFVFVRPATAGVIGTPRLVP
jgi:hypothetical protein